MKKSVLNQAVDQAMVITLADVIRDIINARITDAQKSIIEQAVVDKLELMGLLPPSKDRASKIEDETKPAPAPETSLPKLADVLDKIFEDDAKIGSDPTATSVPIATVTVAPTEVPTNPDPWIKE